MILQDPSLIFFGIYVLGTGFFAGITAAVTGFGIGSLLTPVLSIQIGTKLAIALVSIPHFIGTALRFWVLKGSVDKKIFIEFGISSIAGGLLGALLFWKINSPALTVVFGIILIFAGLVELTGFLQKIRMGKTVAFIGGILSGFLGGLVGNQGGIRSAALLSFNLNKKSFIATATAIGLVVDAVRMPVYVALQGKEIISEWRYILLATLGVIIGTLIGIKVLEKIPKAIFRRVVAFLIIILGVFMIFKFFY